MKTALIALLAICLIGCGQGPAVVTESKEPSEKEKPLPKDLKSLAEKKKTDVEEAGYEGRGKSVKVSEFKIEEKDGKQVRTPVQASTPSAKYDEKGNNVKETEFRAINAFSETRLVPTKEQTWEFTYWK
jgi:hypothetical protein